MFEGTYYEPYNTCDFDVGDQCSAKLAPGAALNVKWYQPVEADSYDANYRIAPGGNNLIAACILTDGTFVYGEQMTVLGASLLVQSLTVFTVSMTLTSF